MSITTPITKEKRSIRITHALRQECLEFLQTLGFICMTCENHEAEAMCSELARQNVTTATVTEGKYMLRTSITL